MLTWSSMLLFTLQMSGQCSGVVLLSLLATV